MFKRGMYLVTSVVVVFLLLIVYWYIYDWDKLGFGLGSGQNEIRISSWHYDLDKLDSDKAKFTYGITLLNGSEESKFVRFIQPNYNKDILFIIEPDNVISISKEIKANEECKFSWDIIVNTKNLTELNIKTVKLTLENVTIAMNNGSITYFQH